VSALASVRAIRGQAQHQQNLRTEQTASATAARIQLAAMHAARTAEISDAGCRPMSGCRVARKALSATFRSSSKMPERPRSMRALVPRSMITTHSAVSGAAQPVGVEQDLLCLGGQILKLLRAIAVREFHTDLFHKSCPVVLAPAIVDALDNRAELLLSLPVHRVAAS
jgi:hypothetical protein